jgi:hypothetical protein
VQPSANPLGRIATAVLRPLRQRGFQCRRAGATRQRKSASLRSILRIGFLLPALLSPPICHCASQPNLFSVSEEDVKAAVLYHLIQFVDWPSEKNSGVYRICVAGDTATSTALQHVTQGRLVRSHPIQIERISGPVEARGCHILFIRACAKPRLAQYLMSVRDSGILTVGEQPGFLQSGGMIELFFQGQRVGVSLSSETIQRSRLIVSSKLLRLDRRAGEKIPLENH